MRVWGTRTNYTPFASRPHLHIAKARRGQMGLGAKRQAVFEKAKYWSEGLQLLESPRWLLFGSKAWAYPSPLQSALCSVPQHLPGPMEAAHVILLLPKRASMEVPLTHAKFHVAVHHCKLCDTFME